MAPEVLFLAILVISFLTGATAVGILVVRAFVRRTAGASSRSIALGVVSAFATAVLVFILVYVSAWAETRQQVAMGDIGSSRIMRMRLDFLLIRQALSDYAHKHRHYPDSLKEVPELENSQFHDPWDHPYQYTKTTGGYSLLSLGRDGKPGGSGLDADIDSEQGDGISIEPTLSQFLFQAVGSGTLFTIAVLASCFAGLASYIASGPREGNPVAIRPLLASIAITTVGAVLVSLFLVFIYLMGEHH